MPFHQALQPLRSIEPGPFRSQRCNSVTLFADVGMQPQHTLGAHGGFHLDPIDIGCGENQNADHEDVDDPHGQPTLMTSARTGHAGSSAAAKAGPAVRSAARSFAERARGLAATSSSPAMMG